ncbi:phage late control D family protein [Chitinophaga sp. CF418]|uniref:phage late control D family protein n=1 Tax=Chitinophaga sp. CF418 TaxID=1855287 RepID=UPI0009111CDB|nr:hypothetical protein [Chitinophaga sp. CF418]SHN42230.1 hypothetical protein SAMN05216311_114143 [Chitinophaga sp. CF418]
MQVAKAVYEVIYNGKNISGSILPYVLAITYSDRTSGEADTLDIALEDSSGLWQFAWHPAKGDKLSVTITFKGNVLKCGTFTIDGTTLRVGPDGDIVTIRAIAAGITSNIRTTKFIPHEQKTLREIANVIAKDQGLILQGDIPEIRIERKSQYKKTDLHFLQELADAYGYTFSIRDSILTFTNMYELEGKDAALTINKNELISADIDDRTSQTFQAVDIKYHHPRKKTTIIYSAKESDAAFSGVKADTLVLRRRVENDQQAEAIAKAAMYQFNSMQQQGSIEVQGNPFLVAGASIQLNGIGVYSGKYYVNESTHNVSRDGGYSTSATIKRVGLIDQNNYK